MRLLRRLRFAGIEVDLPAVVLQAAATARALDEIDSRGAPAIRDGRRSLAALAPPSIVVPSGRSMRRSSTERTARCRRR